MVVTVLACLLAVGMVATSALAFTDDFSRADGTTIGNGWVETATGNDGQYGSYTLPDASIVDGVVKFDRNGYGWGANSAITQTLTNGSYVRVDIFNPADNALVMSHFGLENGAGDGIYLDIYRTSATNVHLTVQKTLASYGYPGWYTFFNTDLGNIDWATYEVFTNPAAATPELWVKVTSGGTEIANIDFGGWIQPLFTTANVYTTWGENAYGTYYTYADNFSTAPVPEPSSLLALLAGLPVIFIRRRK